MTEDSPIQTAVTSIETRVGPVSARIVGSGPLLIIVHGGPGLEHTYLWKWLYPLSSYRTLLFYDQSGSGRDQTPADEVTDETIIDQLGAIVETVETTNNVGILAHSWGSHVALSFLSKAHVPLDELILISPMALTSARLEQAMQRLADRFPAEVLEQYDQLLSTANADDAVKAMNLLLPNYVFSKKNIPAIEFAAYNTEIEQRVNESVGEFDLRQVGSFLPRKTLIIYGEGDFEKPDNTKELQGQPTKVVVLPEVGHFPFAEKPQQFIDTVTQFLRG